MSKNRKYIVVKMTIGYGSTFQKSYMENLLKRIYLPALKAHFETSHKRNSVSYGVTEEMKYPVQSIML